VEEVFACMLFALGSQLRTVVVVSLDLLCASAEDPGINNSFLELLEGARL